MVVLAEVLMRGRVTERRPHHHRDVWEALEAPKARKLVGDTVPLMLSYVHRMRLGSPISR